MANILVAAFGSLGDVLPFIGIGRELRQRGHGVTFIGNPYFARHVADAGMSLSAVGTVADYHELMTDSTVFHWRTALDTKVQLHFVHIIEPVYEAVLRLHEPGRTVLFASGISSGPWVAVEKCGIPFVGGVVTPSRFSSRYDPPHPPWPLPPWVGRLGQTRTGLRLLNRLGTPWHRLATLRRPLSSSPPPSAPLLEEVNRVRARVQLPAIGGATPVRLPPPQRIVCFWPDWFARKQRDWPTNADTTGFPYYPPAEAEMPALPKDLPDEGRKPLVFTTGSVACEQESFFAAAANACQILKQPGLLVTPHAHQVPPQLPPGVTHIAYAPFSQLFARAGMVIHHGGIGTIALALAAGVPQIVRPIMGDQFDLGNRMQRLGVGRMIPGEAVTSTRLARAIESVLDSARVSGECRRWQRCVDPRGGLVKPADAVESVVR